MKFPIGGKVRERLGAGFGVIPKPTVKVWMEEDAGGNEYILFHLDFYPAPQLFSQRPEVASGRFFRPEKGGNGKV